MGTSLVSFFVASPSQTHPPDYFHNFFMCTSTCIIILLMISSDRVTILFIIYPIKAQLVSMTFAASPQRCISHHLCLSQHSQTTKFSLNKPRLFLPLCLSVHVKFPFSEMSSLNLSLWQISVYPSRPQSHCNLLFDNEYNHSFPMIDWYSVYNSSISVIIFYSEYLPTFCSLMSLSFP